MRRALAGLFLLLGAACSSSAPPADSGINGTVVIGPTCPVEGPGLNCGDKPYDGTIRVLDARGGLVVTVRSGPDGRFRVALAPGRYVLEGVPPDGGGLPFAKRVEVTVEPHAFARATVAFDSGIR